MGQECQEYAAAAISPCFGAVGCCRTCSSQPQASGTADLVGDGSSDRFVGAEQWGEGREAAERKFGRRRCIRREGWRGALARGRESSCSRNHGFHRSRSWQVGVHGLAFLPLLPSLFSCFFSFSSLMLLFCSLLYVDLSPYKHLTDWKGLACPSSPYRLKNHAIVRSIYELSGTWKGTNKDIKLNIYNVVLWW